MKQKIWKWFLDISALMFVALCVSGIFAFALVDKLWSKLRSRLQP